MTDKPRPTRYFTCSLCSRREAAAGGQSGFICLVCKAAGKYPSSSSAAWELLGGAGAMAAVAKAVKAGALPEVSSRQCDDCGKPATLYEHRNYNKPLDVVPVCRSCNSKRGPAIPRHDGIKKLVSFGFIPYASKARATQLFARLGLDTDLLDRLPNKKLDHAAWASLLPAFDQPPKETMSEEVITATAELPSVSISEMCRLAPDLFCASALFLRVEPHLSNAWGPYA